MFLLTKLYAMCFSDFCFFYFRNIGDNDEEDVIAEPEDPVAELLREVGQGVQDKAEQIPAHIKRLESKPQKVHISAREPRGLDMNDLPSRYKPQIEKGIKMATVMCR